MMARSRELIRMRSVRRPRIAGEVDYLLKLQVADIAAYDRVYKSLIRSARLMDVSASFAMEELKRTTAVPLPSKA